MRWLGWPGRRRTSWRKSSRTFTLHTPSGPNQPVPQPPPRPRTLVEVLGIGRTVMVNGVPLTLLSYERYREGDFVTFSLTSRRGFHLDYSSPEIFLRVGPAASTATPRFSDSSGGGGGDGQELRFRFSFGFSPPMPDDATDWIVEVTKIEWVK